MVSEKNHIQQSTDRPSFKNWFSLQRLYSTATKKGDRISTSPGFVIEKELILLPRLARRGVFAVPAPVPCPRHEDAGVDALQNFSGKAEEPGVIVFRAGSVEHDHFRAFGFYEIHEPQVLCRPPVKDFIRLGFWQFRRFNPLKSLPIPRSSNIQRPCNVKNSRISGISNRWTRFTYQKSSPASPIPLNRLPAIREFPRAFLPRLVG